MRFQRLDLNLLVALDALLTERSVSLAAERVFLSQSAMSSALGRLRDYFGDELLVLKGRQMVLTARAEDLVEPVRAVLEQIRTTIAAPIPFDPKTSDRVIKMMASDYVTEVALATTLSDLSSEAPNMRFEIQPMSEQVVETLERGFIDLLITIDYAISADHPSKLLFEDDYVVVGWSGNPAMAQPMTRDLYFDLEHVVAGFGKGKVSAFDDWFMRRQKQSRKVKVLVPSFLSMSAFIVGTNRIATMHRRMAARLSANLPLVSRAVPFDIPSIREAIQWHVSNDNDPALRWVIERLCAGAQDASAVAPTDAAREDLAAEWKQEYGAPTRA
jgi:LysR family transcriptional regulator, nod-box dependent transcriptional activator